MKFSFTKARFYGLPVLLAVLLIGLAFVGPDSQQAYAALDNEPTRKVEIVIQSSKVSANLTDFPVLLTEDNIPSEACDADGASPAQDGGGDIRFTSDENGNTRLALEVIDFTTNNDPANCTVEMYVKVPSVSATADTSIWMWYNTATSDLQPSASSTYGSESVWDGDFEGVWHLSEASGSRSDSTANGNTLTDNNTVGSTAGKWGTAGDFEYDNDESLSITEASQSGLDISTALTVSGWVNLESSGQVNGIVTKWGGTSDRAYQAYKGNDEKLRLEVTSDGSSGTQDTVVSSSTLSTGTWTHVAFVYDASNRMAVYIDAVQDAENTSGIDSSIYNSSAEFHVGSTNSGQTGYMWDGALKDIRVSSVVRSADWISTEYNNQNDAGAFAVEQTPMEGSTAPDSSTVVKSADESVTSSTTLQNDDELTFSLEANTKYVISGGVFATSTSAQPDVKIGFDVPTGSTMDIGYLAQGGNMRSAELLETDGGASSRISIPSGDNAIIQPFGSVVTGGTAGNLVFQWAQNSSDATATTVKQGSFITVNEVTE